MCGRTRHYRRRAATALRSAPRLPAHAPCMWSAQSRSAGLRGASRRCTVQPGFTYARPADAYRRAGEASGSKHELQLNAPTHLQQEGWHMQVATCCTRRGRYLPQQTMMTLCKLRPHAGTSFDCMRRSAAQAAAQKAMPLTQERAFDSAARPPGAVCPGMLRHRRLALAGKHHLPANALLSISIRTCSLTSPACLLIWTAAWRSAQSSVLKETADTMTVRARAGCRAPAAGCASRGRAGRRRCTRGRPAQ